MLERIPRRIGGVARWREDEWRTLHKSNGQQHSHGTHTHLEARETSDEDVSSAKTVDDDGQQPCGWMVVLAVVVLDVLQNSPIGDEECRNQMEDEPSSALSPLHAVSTKEHHPEAEQEHDAGNDRIVDRQRRITEERADVEPDGEREIYENHERHWGYLEAERKSRHCWLGLSSGHREDLVAPGN